LSKGENDLGKIAANILAHGSDWSVSDVVCSSGPQDRPFQEQHGSILIAVVVEGSFQYRSAHGSEVMAPGSLLLDNYGQCFECAHEHGTGDRCVAFQYAPEFFERAGVAASFPVHRIPPMTALSAHVVEARLALQPMANFDLEELAHGISAAALQVFGKNDRAKSVSAADERRISATLRFIEAHLHDPLPLKRLASTAKMSEFHFLRTFKQVTCVTPHQFILRARLRGAAVRLRNSLDEVMQVALDSGFRDLSNFNHAFRAEFGLSPTAYARRA
jgi:AraC family transcriptional regulator